MITMPTKPTKEMGAPAPKQPEPPAAMPAEAAPQVTPEAEPFVQTIFKKGWNIADTFFKVEIIDRPENDRISLGFLDLNDRKEIVLTSLLDKWEGVFDDGLTLVYTMKYQNATGFSAIDPKTQRLTQQYLKWVEEYKEKRNK